jgi:hypothetical protein
MPNTVTDEAHLTAVINGEMTARPLIWDDFKGIPDDNSSFYAFTVWNMKSEVINVKFRKDTVVFSYKAYAELGDSSWIKKGKESDYLLKHEQGHFDIAKLCAKEITETMKRTVFLRSEFPAKFNIVLKEIREKYNIMTWRYDLETNHSKDKANQKKWDYFFQKELQVKE